MKNLRVSLLLVIILSLSSTNIYTQWIAANGPYGGFVTALAASENKIYVGASTAGLFVSSDEGSNWNKVNGDYPADVAILTMTTSGNKIYAAFNYYGLYVSSNDGLNWTKLKSWSTNTECRSIAIDNDMIYVATEGDGIYISSDKGKNWQKATSGLNSEFGFRYIIMNGSTIFAGSYHGIYTSTDKGMNWKNIGLNDKNVESIGFSTDTQNKTYIYARTSSGLYQSQDNGSNWLLLNNGLKTLYLNALTIDNGNIYVGSGRFGVYRSTDNGVTWGKTNEGLINHSVYELFKTGDYLFAVTAATLVRSTNSGTTWSISSNGLTAESITQLSSSGEKIYAGGNAIHYTEDNGNSWKLIHPDFQDMTNCTALMCVCNSSSNTLFAGLNYGGIFKSTDEGNDWNNIGFYGDNIYSFVSTGNTLFSGSDIYGGIINKSTDNGNNWVSSYTGLNDVTIKALATDGNWVYAGASGADGGVYRKVSNGSTWIQLLGLPNVTIQAISVNGKNIIVGTDQNVYASSDEGLNWSFAAKGLTNKNVHSFVANGYYVFAATDGGVFLTTDFGSNWKSINTGLIPTKVYSLAINSNYIFAGTDGRIWKRSLSDIITDVKDIHAKLPIDFSISQNYPNPFNPTTTINYSIPKLSDVLIKIYDVLGNEVVTLVNEEKPAGNYQVQFNAESACSRLTSGIYFYTLKAGEFSQTKKLTLIK